MTPNNIVILTGEHLILLPQEKLPPTAMGMNIETDNQTLHNIWTLKTIIKEISPSCPVPQDLGTPEKDRGRKSVRTRKHEGWQENKLIET